MHRFLALLALLALAGCGVLEHDDDDATSATEQPSVGASQVAGWLASRFDVSPTGVA